jgi:hypothetical protein
MRMEEFFDVEKIKTRDELTTIWNYWMHKAKLLKYLKSNNTEANTIEANINKIRQYIIIIIIIESTSILRRMRQGLYCHCSGIQIRAFYTHQRFTPGYKFALFTHDMDATGIVLSLSLSLSRDANTFLIYFSNLLF